MRMILIAPAMLCLAAPALAEIDEATKKALETVQFENAARVCAQHVTSTLPDGTSTYERGFEDCRTIMARKQQREANPGGFK